MNIKELLDICIDKNLIDMTISSRKLKDETKAQKVKIRPVIIKDTLEYQVSEFVGRKVLHTNYTQKDVKKRIEKYMEEEFKQAQITRTDSLATILSSKSGTCTCKYKKAKEIKAQKELSHNRTKKYIIQEGTPVGFMIDLGVMTPDGRIVRTRYDKFRQINRFLEFIEDILPRLDKDKEQTIIDFGCGKSYLTFAMYYYLKELRGYPIRIIGLDLKEDVICRCDTLAKSYGYDRLSFCCGDIASYEGVDRVDMVVTLHACDLATDYAMEKAVGWGAKVILSVPCCQHELNRQIENPLMKPVFGYGLIKERMAALYTDAIRAQVLEYRGYRTQILEFIDMEHTPKNILIRAVRQGNDAAFKKAREKTGTELRKLLEFLQADPAIVRLLAPELGTGERAGTDE